MGYRGPYGSMIVVAGSLQVAGLGAGEGPTLRGATTSVDSTHRASAKQRLQFGVRLRHTRRATTKVKQMQKGLARCWCLLSIQDMLKMRSNTDHILAMRYRLLSNSFHQAFLAG